MTAPASLAVALFDLDDTLFAHRESVERGIEAHVASLGAPYTSLEASVRTTFWRDLEERHYHSYLAGELDFDGQRRARARDFAARHGVALDDDAATAFWSAFFEHYVEGWRLHDDALPCLDALQSTFPGIHFGLITNGELPYQRRKVEAVGLDTRIDHIIASAAVGITKPDPAIFAHACAVFGVEPGRAVYIGDRLRTDAIGASAAGLQGVWLNRHGTEPTDAEARDAHAANVIEISSLSELPGALTTTRRRRPSRTSG